MNLLEHLQSYECHLMAEDTSHEELVALEKDLPSDVHLVRYWPKAEMRERQTEASGLAAEDLIAISGIRAYKKSDIFDALWDAGFEVLEIANGYGRIKPKMYGYQSPNQEDQG